MPTSVWSPPGSTLESVQRPLERLRHAIELAQRELDCVRRAYSEAERLARDTRPDQGPKSSRKLSRQEARVAALLAEGLANRDIAEALHVSVHTVKSHVQSILRKRTLRSRWQLMEAVKESPS